MYRETLVTTLDDLVKNVKTSILCKNCSFRLYEICYDTLVDIDGYDLKSNHFKSWIKIACSNADFLFYARTMRGALCEYNLAAVLHRWAKIINLATVQG